MPTGRVKWFNNAKGYGFILPEDGDEDLFVHYSSIQMDGYKTLKAGQGVTYELLQGPKGSHAVNIVLLDLPPPESEPTSSEPSSEDDSDDSAQGDETSTQDQPE